MNHNKNQSEHENHPDHGHTHDQDHVHEDEHSDQHHPIFGWLQKVLIPHNHEHHLDVLDPNLGSDRGI